LNHRRSVKSSGAGRFTGLSISETPPPTGFY